MTKTALHLLVRSPISGMARDSSYEQYDVVKATLRSESFCDKH